MLTSATKYTDVFDITSTMLFPLILLMMLDNFLNKNSGHILELAPSDVRLNVQFKTFLIWLLCSGTWTERMITVTELILECVRVNKYDHIHEIYTVCRSNMQM